MGAYHHQTGRGRWALQHFSQEAVGIDRKRNAHGRPPGFGNPLAMTFFLDTTRNFTDDAQTRWVSVKSDPDFDEF